MGMSQYDVKQYLEKIYNVPVVYVRTYIQQGKLAPLNKSVLMSKDSFSLIQGLNFYFFVPGKFRRVPRKGYIVKDDDFKVAFVTLVLVL